MKLIDKDAAIAEIEKRIAEYKDMKIDSSYYEGMVASLEFFRDEFINTLEVKEVDLDAYTKVSKALSVPFMQFLDNIRPEGKMCLSNAECFDIEKAFAMMDYSKLLRYMEKYSTIKTQKGE